MDNKENIINYDYQGWPEFKMSIKDILERFGAVLNPETNKWEIENNEKLNVFPTILEDDGMGYGVNPKYIIDIDYKGEVDYCNIWSDVKLDNVELFAKHDLHPGIFFTNDGKEYTIHDVVTEDGKDFVKCNEWLYDGSKEFKGPMIGKEQKVDIEIVLKALKNE